VGEALKAVEVVRVDREEWQVRRDAAAAEEPLEVRLHGCPFAVIMRTPGADRELTAGFLLSEGVLRTAGDLSAIEYCSSADPEGRDNIVNVTLVGDAAARADRRLGERRNVSVGSSCGMCGRLTIESLKCAGPAIAASWTMSAGAISRLPERLRAAQTVFDETGGLHAAGIFTSAGTLQMSAEDVGRHNAVDKVIGRMLMAEALPLSTSALFVSGRSSFEIVQKAFLAGLPIVASVSAPSTLAIDLARETGITLIGFVRGSSFNVYAHPWRVERAAASRAATPAHA